jgi:uncharacterized protein (DUF983 family)
VISAPSSQNTAIGIDDAIWQEEAARPLARSMLRGALGRCPNCGDGALFEGFIKVSDSCARCGEILHHQRADDAPPYFVTFVVGHVVVSLVLAVEVAFSPPTWVHLLLWAPLTLILSLLLLRPIKGAIIGLQWANRMHGFGGEVTDDPVDVDVDFGSQPG